MSSLVSSLTLLALLTPLISALLLVNETSAPKHHCRNSGRLTIKNNKTICVCPLPFIGRYCEDAACVNGLSTGDQYDPISIFFNKRCLCDPGWTGELCDSSLINRCGDNGREINGKCQCQPNFVGDRCEYVIKCTHGQLFNGRCACLYGWAGDFCDKIICHQGHADETNTACICPPKYRGSYCDFCAEPSSTPPPECAELDGRRSKTTEGDGDKLAIILALIATIILVASGIAFYFFCYRVGEAKRESANARQAQADLEGSSKRETEPLHANIENVTTQTTVDIEKHNIAPPPYEAIASEFRKQALTVKRETEFDSGIGMSTSSAQSDEQGKEPFSPSSDKSNPQSPSPIKQKVRFSEEAVVTSNEVENKNMTENEHQEQLNENRSALVKSEPEMAFDEQINTKHGENACSGNEKEECVEVEVEDKVLKETDHMNKSSKQIENRRDENEPQYNIGNKVALEPP